MQCKRACFTTQKGTFYNPIRNPLDNPMVTNPKNNHNPPKPEQTGLRLCKDNSYTPLHPLPLSHFILSPVSFHSLPCLISPPFLSHFTLSPVPFHSLPYLIPLPITPSNHQKTYPTKPLKQNDCTLRRACLQV